MTKQNDLQIITDLLSWKWHGDTWTTYEHEEPKLHKDFIRLEQLGIATFLKVKIDSFIWKVDYAKAKQVAKQLSKRKKQPTSLQD